MSGRTRRNIAQQPGKVALNGALAALQAAREGGTKRASTFEVKQEDDVYDVVDDEQYAQLAAKRKIEAGEFFVCVWLEMRARNSLKCDRSFSIVNTQQASSSRTTTASSWAWARRTTCSAMAASEATAPTAAATSPAARSARTAARARVSAFEE